MSDRDPSDFPGNPNPPAKTPEPAKAPAATIAPSGTSAGTGALPPEAQDQSRAGAAPLASAPLSYTISENENGSRDIYAFSDDGAQKVGSVTLAKDDADKILKGSNASYDKDRGVYDNVPESVMKTLASGRPSMLNDLKARFGAGEAELHRSSLYAAALLGQMSFADAKERSAPDLVQAQLAHYPESAWKGLGDAITKFSEHPIDEGEDILRHSLEKTAEALPSIAKVIKGAVVGGVAGGAAGLLGGAVAPVTAPGLAAMGAKTGTFLSLLHMESGGIAADMSDRGFDEATIRKVAPAAGAVKAALWMYGVDAMATPFKNVFFKGLASSEAVQKLTSSWAYNYMLNAGIKMPALGAAQSMVGDLTNNLAALVDKRPDLMKPGPDMLKNAVSTAIDMGQIGAVAGIPGAAIEGISGIPKSEIPGAESDRSPKPLEGGPLSSLPQEAGSGESPASAAGIAKGGMNPVTPEEALTSNSSSSSQSITPETVKVKAQEAAQPFLEKYAKSEGRDANDPAFARELYEKHNDAVHEVARKMGFIKPLAEMTPEDKVAMMQKMREMTPEEKENLNKVLTESQPVVAALQRKVQLDISPEIAESWAKMDAEAEAKNPPVSSGESPVGEKGPEGESVPKEREFFKNPEIEVKPLETDKATAADIRAQYVGDRDVQIARINQKMRAFRQAVPDEVDRQAATWWVDAGGDRAKLAEMLEEPKLKDYHPQIERALNLPENAQRWAETAQRYFNEAAEVGQEKGTLNTARENYVNRLYLPEKEGDFVKGAGSASGVSRSTGHALERKFDTMADAATAGKRFATTDLADLVTNYNSELARANSARAMADSMVDSGLGAWKQEKNVPKGWDQVGNLSKSVPVKDLKTGEVVVGDDGNQVVSKSIFVAPAKIAEGLKAIAEPNFTRKIDSLRGIQRYQGLVKTVDLSFSLFHHLSMIAQLAYAGNFSDMLKLKGIDRFLEAPDFVEREQEFIRHGGTTAITSDNVDILRRLTEDKGDTFSKIVNLPGVKQVLQQADKSSDYLFAKVRRLWAVNTFSQLATDWAAKHPDAENAEVTTAMRELARHVNDRFGGQNWEAMGMTKSNLSLLRIGLLAPDWTISNLHLLKAAIGEGGAGGRASRIHVLSSLVVGMAATEGLNMALTGHSTEENKEGHKLEVEIAPDVYVSLLRGGVQDITKLASMISESGLAGVSRFAQGKLGPFARTGVGLLTNTQYSGKAIAPKKAGPIAGTYDVLKYALSSNAPVPLGISNLIQYAQSEHPNAIGAAAVATGVGRFSQGKKER